MGDMGDLYRDLRDHKKEKKLKNLEYAENILKNYEYRKIDEYLFYIGPLAQFEFWPTTGLFRNRETGRKGRGINNLLLLIKKFKKDNYKHE